MKLGLYQHYKGGRYLVLGTAQDANADVLYIGRPCDYPPYTSYGSYQMHGREVVVYVAVEHDEPYKHHPRLWVRTADDFNQKLCGVRVDNTMNNGWHTCAKPLGVNDRCPDHEHTNTPPVLRFTCLERD